MKRISYKGFAGPTCWLNRERNNISHWATYIDHLTHPTLVRYSFGYHFDAAISSEDGQYAVVYHKLGTKGLLLKSGEILREIDRSYYMAEVYEYPVAFAYVLGKTYLVHCPKDYCRIDLEDVETGELVTDAPGRKPQDFFHSRFEISPDNRKLLSRGWGWHPYDDIKVFDLEAALKDPLILDGSNPVLDSGVEICAGSFIDNNRILIGAGAEVFDDEAFPCAMNSNSIAIWDIRSNEISNIITPGFRVGAHLYYIGYDWAWDLHTYPKIINIRTGGIVDEEREVDSGRQASSIITDQDSPNVAFNRKTKQVAIAGKEVIDVLTNDLAITWFLPLFGPVMIFGFV